MEEKRFDIEDLGDIRPVEVAEYIYKKINEMEEEEGKKPDEIVEKTKEIVERIIVEMKHHILTQMDAVLMNK